MSFHRITVDPRTSNHIAQLQTRTKLQPNVLCRLALCLSFASAGVPDPSLYAETGGREFNRSTLTGELDGLYVALLRQRLAQDGLDYVANEESQFKAHVCRGVGMLYERVHSLEGLADLVLERSGSASL